MRWPWTSRARLDDLRTERDWLRQKVDDLTAQLVRLERKREGLPEVPKERPKLEPMPVELRRYLLGFASTGRQQIAEVFRRHAAGESWDAIIAGIMPAETDDDFPDPSEQVVS